MWSPTAVCRVLVLAGGLLYVVGGLVGWFVHTGFYSGPSDDVPIRLHDFFAIGAWAWLVAAPMFVAAVAPCTRRWLAFLWLTPAPSLLLALALALAPRPWATAFPHGLLVEDPRWGLTLSLVGSALATVALVAALIVVVVRPDRASRFHIFRRLKRVDRRVLIGASLLALSAVVTVALIRRDPETDRVEAQLAKVVRRTGLRCGRPYPVNKPTPDPQVRTHCDRIKPRLWECIFDYSAGRVSLGGWYTTDGTHFDKMPCS